MRDNDRQTDNDRGIVIELRPKDAVVDFSQIVVDISNGRPVDLSSYDVFCHNSIIDSFRPEFLSYIVEYGLTSFLQRRQLTEALVPPGTNIDEVQMLLRSYLIGSSVTTDLVIVDPYFFVSSDAGYPQFVEQILHPVLGRLNNLTVVTLPNKVNVLALSSITNLLNTSSPNLNIIHKTSIAFHDRFWINPISSKGFLTGTSLNGLGRRYALVDYLQSSDVAEVLAVLQREGVL